MKKLAIIGLVILIGLVVSIYFLPKTNLLKHKNVQDSFPTTSIPADSVFETLVGESTNSINIETNNEQVEEVELVTPPLAKTLNNNYHIYQTFNNCGPASLSMALSYFGINKTQQELGQELRPYQHPKGNNDDKSVTMEELAAKAEEHGLVAYFRPNGNVDLIKYAITYDLPVIVKTWLAPNDDTGHYRVVKGYDESLQVIVQDDSMQGDNVQYSYQEFNTIWKKFNYEFLLLVPQSKVEIVNKVLGDNLDEKFAWETAALNARKTLEKNPNDIDARFNLVVALTNIGNHQGAIGEFEEIENKIKLKRLWYQIEPIQSYFEVGDYNKVLNISDDILSNGNAAYSELYILRGKSYEALGNNTLAKEEFNKALIYNKNLSEAIELNK